MNPPEPSKRALEIEALEIELERKLLELEAPCSLVPGVLYLVEGASGVGKSSLARALLGLDRAVSPPLIARCRASLSWDSDHEVIRDEEEGFRESARAHLGYMPQAGALSFIDDLSTEDNLGLFSRLPGPERRAAIEDLARRFGVWPLPGRPSRASGGERMRLSAVRALLPRHRGDRGARVLIADEPTTGLDAEAARVVARTLLDVARAGEAIVIVITHDPSPFLDTRITTREAPAADSIRISSCSIGEDGARPADVVALLRTTPREPSIGRAPALAARAASVLEAVGSLVVAPLALVRGVMSLGRISSRTLLRSTLSTTLDLGTWLFVAAAAVVVGVTLSYFAFERMPRRRMLEPLFLEEFLAQFGLVMLLVLPPLFAALFASAKIGAAQAARLAAAVKSGLLETLAIARIDVESYALLPAVLAQVLALAVTTVLAMALALTAAALVFLSSGSALSLDLALSMMLSALERAPNWQVWLLARICVSGAVAGIIAASFGLRPGRGRERDVADAVHSTLLWTLLAILAVQCGFIVAELG